MKRLGQVLLEMIFLRMLLDAWWGSSIIIPSCSDASNLAWLTLLCLLYPGTCHLMKTRENESFDFTFHLSPRMALMAFIGLKGKFHRRKRKTSLSNNRRVRSSTLAISSDTRISLYKWNFFLIDINYSFEN